MPKIYTGAPTRAHEEAGGTLGEAILHGAAKFPETPYVVASEVRPHETTLVEFVDDAKVLAGSLQRLGVRPGDVVALQLPNWYAEALIEAAVALCGATSLPIVQIYGRHEVEFILRDSGAKVFFVPAEWRGRSFVDMVSQFGALPDLEVAVVVDKTASSSFVRFAELMDGSADAYQQPTVDPASVALLVYTSGSTGNAKGVMHSHRSLLAEVTAAAGSGYAGPSARYLAAFPSGHMAGLLGLLRMAVLGTPTVSIDLWDPERAARLVDQHRLRASSGAPIHLDGLLDARDRGIATLSSMREFMLGGTSIPSALVERADAAGIVAYRSYGMSEHPTITLGRPGDTAAQRTFTDGRLTAGTQVRILDDNGIDVGPGEEGEFAIRGPEQFIGYRDPKLNEETHLPGGWFLTGDIGRIDDQGFLTVTDRKKDIIVRAAENISSKEVEDILAAHPRVAEVAIVGAPDERYGERVCAFVVLVDSGELTLDEIAAHFQAAGLARQKTPEIVKVLDALPRTPFGKVRKKDLRDALA